MNDPTAALICLCNDSQNNLCDRSIVQLINARADIHCVFDIAVHKNKSSSIINKLLEHKANPNFGNWRALNYAIAMKYNDIVQTILEANVQIEAYRRDPYQTAILNKNAPALELLIKYSPNEYWYNSYCIYQCLQHPNLPVMKLLVEFRHNQQELITSITSYTSAFVECTDVDVIEYILGYVPITDEMCYRLLAHQIHKERIAEFIRLFRCLKRTKPYIINIHKNTIAPDLVPSLVKLAVSKPNSEELVEYLIDMNADLNESVHTTYLVNGYDPRRIAKLSVLQNAICQPVSIVKLLLKNGAILGINEALVEICDSQNKEEYLAQIPHIPSLLLEYGADETLIPYSKQYNQIVQSKYSTFLLGLDKTIGGNSPIYRAFVQNALSELNLIRIILAF